MNYREEADRVFSISTRLSYADHAGFLSCYTCEERNHWTQVDCGHFITRGHSIVRYDKRNARPQCISCNRSRNGMPEAFEEHLREDLGDEEVDNLISLGRKEKQFTVEEYKEIIQFHKEKIRGLGVKI